MSVCNMCAFNQVATIKRQENKFGGERRYGHNDIQAMHARMYTYMVRVCVGVNLCL